MPVLSRQPNRSLPSLHGSATSRRRTAGILCVVCTIAPFLILGAQCTPADIAPSAVSFTIDPDLKSPSAPKTVLSAGEERPVGLAQGPDGVTEAFVLDEVMVRAETQEEL